MDDKRKAAAIRLLESAQAFWEACAIEGQYGAVQWLEDCDGRLLIYTRGEYRQELMSQVCKMPSSKVHFFQGEVIQPTPEEHATHEQAANALKARVAQQDTELLELRSAMETVSADCYDVSAARIERDDAIRRAEAAEARVAELESEAVLLKGLTKADEERLRAAESRVFGAGITWGCGAAEALADTVEFLRRERNVAEAQANGLRGDVLAAAKEADSLREQLKSVANRAATAETALEAAPAAGVPVKEVGQ
jgi:hypothetical protein